MPTVNNDVIFTSQPVKSTVVQNIAVGGGEDLIVNFGLRQDNLLNLTKIQRIMISKPGTGTASLQITLSDNYENYVIVNTTFSDYFVFTPDPALPWFKDETLIITVGTPDAGDYVISVVHGAII